MNQSSERDFRKIALETRHLLLLAITHLRKKENIGASKISVEITENAIKNHLIEPRKPPTGAMIQRWIKNKNPPAWAVKSTTILLKNSTIFEPNENEKIPLAFTLTELYYDESPNNIYQQLPTNLQTNLSLDVLEKAKLAVGKKKFSGGS